MKQKSKTYFGSRLIAFIIDLSIVYGFSFILLNLLQLVHLYIPIEILTIIISLLYFPTIAIFTSTSFGKALCKLSFDIASNFSRPIALLLRELVYKQLFFIVPLSLLIKCFKLRWLSPYVEILFCIVVCTVLFIFFLIQKRPWYDLWAKTSVIKNPKNNIFDDRTSIVLILSVFLLVILIRTAYYFSTGTFNDLYTPKRSERVIKPYVSFLQNQLNAKEYIFNLFTKNDIVILCEREHPEMTQYEFIYDLVSDQRFIEHIGNVFSEVGSRTQQSSLDTLMNTDGLNNIELDNMVCHILQNYSFFPMWENTNYFNYFKKLYFLNQSLPKGNRIHHFFTDVGCDWSKIDNKTDYNKVVGRAIIIRDSLLAEKVITSYEAMLSSNQLRNKCLVIMNYRHAFGPTRLQLGDVSCASYIMRKYPKNAVNILLNTVKVSLGLSCPSGISLIPFQKAPIKSGVWDDSFKKVENRSIGFDFKNSPFGKDEFDLFFMPTSKLLKYEDVFTGFIFYKPLEEHFTSYGFKNIIDNGFDNEILKRAAIIDDQSSDPDKNTKNINEKIERIKKQEITVNTKPYHLYSSVINLLFGSALLFLGLTLGLIKYFRTKITKA
jgi:uncharacterized RDD family membrane protein YckC